MSEVVRILGVDPGFRVTGYGLIDTNGQQSVYVAHGSIRNTSNEPAVRLKHIFSELRKVIETYRPDELSIERVFVSRNADSALKLGQARSAAICATFDTPMSVHEYAPRLMKQSLTGRGSADKEQVQHMVRVLLSFDDTLTLDESDALGLALCHANTRALNSLLAGSTA